MPPNILSCDGSLCLFEQAFAPAVADMLYRSLLQSIDWQREALKLYGKSIPVPRLIAWHDKPYKYSGIVHHPRPWTDNLLAIKTVAETLAGVPFNSVLLNLYRDGQDGMGWHADDEPELGPEPVIASVSLGAERKFQVRHKQDKSLRQTLILPPGSCLVMAGAMQRYWQHQVPKTVRPVAPRINLTFRHIE